jgi:uncharacterized membrane protein YhhN
MLTNRIDRRLPWALAALVWLSVLLMLARGWLGIGLPVRWWLVSASTGFVAVRLLRGGMGQSAGRLLLAGLICCWAGDYLGPVDFVGSVIAFGLGHVLFVGAFISVGIERRRLPAAIGVSAVAGVAVGWWLLPEVPREQWALIVGYMVIISMMLVTAWSMRDDPARAMLIAAATLFYISDIFVARWQFVAPGPLNAWLCYPLYYASCLLLALAPISAPAGSD